MPAERTVTVAIGHGKKAARAIDVWLRGTGRDGACPDNAIIKLDTGQYEIDYDYCKGCGICVAECPCGAIAMVPEET